jgi:hypothetical protein
MQKLIEAIGRQTPFGKARGQFFAREGSNVR